MSKRTLVCLIFLLVSILILPVEKICAKDAAQNQSTISKIKTEQEILASLRALYEDKVRFQMLSSAAQSALKTRLRISTKTSPPIIKSKQQRPSGGLPNVLVNNPAQDATNQDSQSETGMVLGTSNIIVGFNDSGSFIGGEAHFTGVSYSSDGGATFTDIGQLPDSGEGDAGDPAFARDNTTGRIYLTTLGFNTFTRLQVFRSDTDGVSWMAPVSCCIDNSAFQDKEWVAVDNVAGSSQGNVYIAWRSFGDGIYFVRSTDHGDTWSTPLKIADQGQFNVQGPFVMTGPNHELYVVYLDNQTDGVHNFIKIRKSTDQGLTFTPAVTITQLMTNGVNGDLGLGGGFRSNCFPHGALNPVTGDIYVAWNDDVSGADKADIFYSASTDGGATWSTPTNVTDLFDSGTKDDWQPTIAISSDGSQAFMGWYDRELDPSNSLIDWFGAVASVGNGVLTFQPQQRISNTSFPVVIGQDPVLNPVYMGDYDTAVVANGFVHTIWGDNRDADNFHAHQPDVRYAKISLGPMGTLQGTVTDSVTTNPIQGAQVDVTPAGGTAFTDASGNYSMTLPIGTYDVTASANGYTPQTVNGVVITDGGTTTQDFQLDPISTCVYENDFNNGVLEWLEEKPTVTEPGDGFLHLDPLKKKAIAVADSAFAGASSGTYTFDVQFTSGVDAKNWLYIARVDKKNGLEVLLKVEQGKVVVRDRNQNILAKTKADFTFAPSTPYNVVINYDGTNVDVTINGTPVIVDFVLTRVLPTANTGAAAKNNSLLIDNVCVE
jgi:hypothetical protein